MPMIERVRRRIEHDIASPMAGSTTSNLIHMCWQNRNSIDNWPRVALLLGATVALAPARGIESIATRRALNEHVMQEPPFFVVGHARSGTTMLFRLLARDEQFGFVRFRQAIFPAMCATAAPLADRLLGGMAPESRPMDDLAFHPDEPEEEEGALDLLSGTGTGSVLYFPRNARAQFDKWALMHGLTRRELRRWENTRDAVFRKASWLAGGKRIVAKNPWNTARLPHLLARWPGAPILHIVRHPFGVYLSAWNALTTGAHIMQMAEIGEDERREFFFYAYRALMQAHLAQRPAVPTGQYAEIRYEQLVDEPLGTLRGVYEQLSLDGWAAFEPRLRRYLADIEGYRPGRFRLERDLAARIAQEWAFAFEQWGYDTGDIVGLDDD